MKGYARNLVISIVLILLNHTLFAQAVTDAEEMFSEGEYFFLSEEYEEALYYPSSTFIGQANLTDPAIFDRFSLDNFPE